jgi:glutaminyl-tRNA synthetase
MVDCMASVDAYRPRFDDTNPDAEKEEYFVAIEETIRWLGFTPYKITYASDYFQRLYDVAEELIKKGKAYVCHCNESETKLQRGGEDGSTSRYRCGHAEQDVETNLSKIPRHARRRVRAADGLAPHEAGH